jgi:hypothetical protein
MIVEVGDLEKPLGNGRSRQADLLAMSPNEHRMLIKHAMRNPVGAINASIRKSHRDPMRAEMIRSKKN